MQNSIIHPTQLLSHSTTQISKADAIGHCRDSETEQDRSMMNDIFRRLQSACPAWRQQLAGLSQTDQQDLIRQTKRDWLNTLIEHRISDMRLIDYAFARLLAGGNPFLPAVGQFVKWCQEGNMPEGTKTTIEAYKEIKEYQCLPREQRQPWGLSPEVYHTFYNIDDHPSWRVMNKADHKKHWDAEYQRTLETLRNNGKLHQSRQPEALIEKKYTPLDKKKAISALQEMRAQL